jgi:hypothetical protein
MDQPNEPHYDVVWPRSRLAVDKQTPASRLDTLAGKRVGFLWDYLFRGEELFPAIADELRDRFADIEFVSFETFGNTHGGDEAKVIGALPENLREHRIDAVISGNGC